MSTGDGSNAAMIRQPLYDPQGGAPQWQRLALLGIWLLMIGWLASQHVPWRDEARAFALALSGDDWPAMFRNVQGEGHPFLWYIILRAGHDLFGVREVLPAAGLLIGIAAVALLVLRSPFRLVAVAAMIFGLALGYEYVVMSRNYGMSALVLFAIAAWWDRIRDRPWLGLMLALLANTNVPAVFLAGGVYLYRMLELAAETRDWRRPEWRRLALNGLLLAAGVLLCFVAVYPPANDAAAITQAKALTPGNLLRGLFDTQRSFLDVGVGRASPMTGIFIAMALLTFIRRPRALIVLLVVLSLMRLFFFAVYPGFYRHSALFFMFLIAIAWIEGRRPGTAQPAAPNSGLVAMLGSWAFLLLFMAQALLLLVYPLRGSLVGQPMSSAGELAKILERPEYRRSYLLIDPDTMGESVSYQTGRPYWLIRQNRPGTVTPLAMTGDKDISLDTIVARADAIHKATGQPVIIALLVPIDTMEPGRYDMMFLDFTTVTPDNVRRFKAATRKIASLRQAREDERYDVYVYPR